MSVWTDVTGTVVIPRSNHFSLSKSICEHFESSNPYIVDSGKFLTITFSFVDDGVSASTTLDHWITHILPKDAKADLVAQVRFLKG